MPGDMVSTKMNCAHGSDNVTCTVKASTTVTAAIVWSTPPRPTAPAGGVFERSRCAFTAAASYAVPSVNLMFGRILIVHCVKSALGVTDSAVFGTYFFVAGAQSTKRSYNAPSSLPTPALPDPVVKAESSRLAAAYVANVNEPPFTGAFVVALAATDDVVALLDDCFSPPSSPHATANIPSVAT